MAIVNSAAKWNQLKDLLGASLNTAGELWIGGERRDGKYYWITGEQISNGRWASGEPNQSGDGVLLGFRGGPEFLWDDRPKRDKMGYLLERSDLLTTMQQSGKLWIGAFREGSTWKWVSNEAFSYARWGDGEPNGSGDRALLGHPPDGNLRWDDTGGDQRFGFLMEYGIHVDGVPNLGLRATSSLPGLVEPVLTYNGRASSAQLVLNLRPNANSVVFGNEPATITLTLTNLSGAARRESFQVTVKALADTPLAGNSRGIDFQGRSQAVTGDPRLAGQSFTFECWARRDGINRIDPLLSQGTNGLFLGFLADNRMKFGFAGVDGAGLISTVTYTDTAWHHWVVTYDALSGRRQIFRDGTLLVQDVLNTPASGIGSLRIGGTAGDTHLDGALQEIRLWRGFAPRWS